MEYRALEYFKYAAAPSHFGVPSVFHRVAIPAAAIAGAPLSAAHALMGMTAATAGMPGLAIPLGTAGAIGLGINGGQNVNNMKDQIARAKRVFG